MKKTSLLSGAFLALMIGVTPQGARAQAATEYGLAAGSSATSVSGVGKALNQKLNVHQTANMASHSSATVHHTQASGSKPRSTNRSPKQASGSGTAEAVPQSGLVVVGADHPSGSASTGTHTLGSSQSGLTVVGAEPQ
jgi:hypothetical protein